MSVGYELSKGRLRWHCRRGLLDLDLILTRFLQQHFDTLDEGQLEALEQLLSYEDTDLWEIVSGRAQCERPELSGLIALLRTP